MTPSLARNVNSAQAIKVGGQEHGCRSDTKWSGNVLTLHPHVERYNYSVITITTLVSKYVALDADSTDRCRYLPRDSACAAQSIAYRNIGLRSDLFSILLHYADDSRNRAEAQGRPLVKPAFVELFH